MAPVSVLFQHVVLWRFVEDRLIFLQTIDLKHFQSPGVLRSRFAKQPDRHMIEIKHAPEDLMMRVRIHDLDAALALPNHSAISENVHHHQCVMDCLDGI